MTASSTVGRSRPRRLRRRAGTTVRPVQRSTPLLQENDPDHPPTPVSVIVLSWNAIEASRRLCDSLAATRFPAYEIVWVDNGSTDGTPDMVREASGSLPIVLSLNETNHGFTAAVNKAIRSIDAGRDIVLLNNDVVIDDPDWLARLQHSANAADDIGLVGCRLRQDDGRLLHIGTHMPVDILRGFQLGSNEL